MTSAEKRSLYRRMNLMSGHYMNLTPEPMELIRTRKKTIELRLYDEKRKAIRVGDKITFTNTEDQEDTLTVSVDDLYLFDSFEELYKALPLTECGYTEEDIDTASPSDMDIYYPKEKQAEYGVVGIKVKVI